MSVHELVAGLKNMRRMLQGGAPKNPKKRKGEPQVADQIKVFKAVTHIDVNKNNQPVSYHLMYDDGEIEQVTQVPDVAVDAVATFLHFSDPSNYNLDDGGLKTMVTMQNGSKKEYNVLNAENLNEDDKLHYVLQGVWHYLS